MGMMDKILRLMAEKKASDVYISATRRCRSRSTASARRSTPSCCPWRPLQLLAEIVSEAQLDEFNRTGELNVAVPLAGVGRFRISAMRQRGSCAVVIRYINVEIPTVESLNIPPC
jgi:twitching motility protein PilU